MKAVEQRLLRIVQSSATRAGKDFALRQLSLIGSDASVPVLAGTLTDKESGEDGALCAGPHPRPVASAALRAALPRLTGNMKIAIVNSLGQRVTHWQCCLAALAGGQDARLAQAAANSLALIGTALHCPPCQPPGPRSRPLSGPVSPRLLAVRGANRGRRRQAVCLKVYKALLAPDQPDMIRVAALGGLAAAAGKTQCLPSARNSNRRAPNCRLPPSAAQSTAWAEITELLVRDTRNSLPRHRSVCWPRWRTGVTAPRDRCFPKPPMARARRFERRAGSLAKIGDSASLPLLAEVAANREGEEQAAARSSSIASVARRSIPRLCPLSATTRARCRRS